MRTESKVGKKNGTEGEFILCYYFKVELFFIYYINWYLEKNYIMVDKKKRIVSFLSCCFRFRDTRIQQIPNMGTSATRYVIYQNFINILYKIY